MSPPTPSINDIRTIIIAQLEAAFNQTIPLLPKAFNRVLANALAGVFILIFKYGGFIFLQIFVKTATIQEVTILGKTLSPLKEWGRLIGAGDPVPAEQAELEVLITVTQQIGVMPAGTQGLNTDNGVTYLLVASVDLNAPTVTGVFRASGDQGGGDGSGGIGNLEVGDIISFANPLSNVNRDTTVTAQIVTGADEEDTEVYRARVDNLFSSRPEGGALIDYVVWGRTVPGVIGIFPYTGANPGEIDVFAEATVESSGDPDGIPTAAQLTAVAEAIQLNDNGLASRRPAGSFVNVDAITRTGFDVTVSGLTVTNPVSVQADIESALIDYFLTRAPFVSGVTPSPRTDSITSSALTGVVNAVVVAADGFFSGLTFKQTGVGGNLFVYILGIGEKSKLTVPVVFAA